MAAARRINGGGALGDLRAGLADLMERCSSFSKLEQDIEKVVGTIEKLLVVAERYRTTVSASTGNAVLHHLHNVMDAVDAFRDYVQTRRMRPDHEHVVGRAEVGRYVRNKVSAAASFVDQLG